LPLNKEENGWGGRIRTCAWRHQKPLPYRLATPQQSTARVDKRPYNERMCEGNAGFTRKCEFNNSI
jgi:hypothetical protein